MKAQNLDNNWSRPYCSHRSKNGQPIFFVLYSNCECQTADIIQLGTRKPKDQGNDGMMGNKFRYRLCAGWKVIKLENDSRRILLIEQNKSQINNIMRVTYLLFAAILLTTLAGASHPRRELPAQPQRSADNIYDFVDHAIKEKYWYYLTKACLLYLTYVDRGDEAYQFLAIYRNLVGTFLAITTWTKGSSSFQVNTLVRVGDGDGYRYGANYKPVNLQPLKLRYSLGANQVVLKVEECCDDENKDDKLVKECKQFSSAVAEKYWYFLDKAKIVYSSVAKTAGKNYCLVTYLNVVGTFLAVGSCDPNTHKNVVNNFVRLGNGEGSRNGAHYDPVSFHKINLRLPNSIEVN